jgi:uncharacterized phage protein gp47/JayE
VPASGDIANRAAAVYEGTPALSGIDARSEASLAAASTRVTELSTLDLYLFQANLAQELLPDTAQDWLARHANIWGVPQLQPTPAVGSVTFAGAVDTDIPADFTLKAPSGVFITTTVSETIPSGGTISVAVTGQASDGTAGNIAAGTTLNVVSPLEGLNPQSAIVNLAADGVSGLSGGTNLELIEAWRTRILARIRAPAMGGSASDYETWAKDALSSVAYASTISNWVGLGTVGVVIALAGPAAPATGDVTTVQNFINTVRPVTAAVTVIAATLLPVNFSLHLNPDTPAIRAGVTSALALEFANDGEIGGTGYRSRWFDAVGSVSGEYSCEMTVPAADVVPTNTQILTLGTITWV